MTPKQPPKPWQHPQSTPQSGKGPQPDPLAFMTVKAGEVRRHTESNRVFPTGLSVEEAGTLQRSIRAAKYFKGLMWAAILLALLLYSDLLNFNLLSWVVHRVFG
jgi:hypothetical protein